MSPHADTHAHRESECASRATRGQRCIQHADHGTVTHPSGATVRLRAVSLGFPRGKDSCTVKLRLPAARVAVLAGDRRAGGTRRPCGDLASSSPRPPSAAPAAATTRWSRSATSPPPRSTSAAGTLWGSNSSRHRDERARDRSRRATTLPAGQTFVFANSRGHRITRDRPTSRYSTGITNTGGVQIRTAARTGHGRRSAPPSAPAAVPRGRGRAVPSRQRPTAASSARSTARRTPTTTPPTSPARGAHPDEVRHGLHRTAAPGPCDAGTLTASSPITSIQTLGANAACNGTTVKVRGIVTGIDDLYGSNFERDLQGRLRHLGPGADARPRARRPRTRSSSPASAATRPTRPRVIGSDITITGRVETKFGQVGIVPAGVGNTGSPAAPGGRPRRASPRSTRPATRFRRRSLLDKSAGRGPGPDHPPVLPLAAGHARPAAGGHRHRRRHDEVPRRLRRAGHRRRAPVPQEQPPRRTTRRGRTSPAELGIAPDGGAGNPADPRLPWRSSDAGRPRPLRHRPRRRRPAELQLQLLQDHAAASAARRRRSSAARSTPRRRRRRRAQPAEHAARGELQRRELLPGREGERRPRDHAGRVRRAHGGDRARDQGPARRAGRGRRAGGRGVPRRRQRPHGPGAALGNYTRLHHDQQRRSRHRDRLPGQGRHDGDQRPRCSASTRQRHRGPARACATSTRASCSTARRTRSTSRRATSRSRR